MRIGRRVLEQIKRMITRAGSSRVADRVQLTPHDFGELVRNDAEEVEGARCDAVGTVEIEGRGIAEADAAVRGGAVVRDEPEGHFLSGRHRPGVRASVRIRSRQVSDRSGVVCGGGVTGESGRNLGKGVSGERIRTRP